MYDSLLDQDSDILERVARGEARGKLRVNSRCSFANKVLSRFRKRSFYKQ